MNYKKYIEKHPEYYKIVKPILESEEFQKRKQYFHHGTKTVYDHCMDVSIIAYRVAKKMNIDTKTAAIAGLLHDFYDKPWQEYYGRTPFFQKHGFVHAKEASLNAKKYFPDLIDQKVEDCIMKHMFPLNIKPPKYKEGWVITCVDKYVSMEIFKHPTKLVKYVGVKGKSK